MKHNQTMKRALNILLLLACSLLVACQGEKNNTPTPAKKSEPKAPTAKTSLPREITLYLYDDFSLSKAQVLADALKKVYPSVSIQKAPIALPRDCYNKERNRYNGGELLKDLTKRRRDNVVLGLTDEVIYQANEISPTYGIFGLSPVGAYVALISSTRPSGKPHTTDHLVKLMLHELGHSFGLRHCKDQHCFMVDAEHGNKFSQTPSFCPNCKQFLNQKGWKIP